MSGRPRVAGPATATAIPLLRAPLALEVVGVVAKGGMLWEDSGVVHIRNRGDPVVDRDDGCDLHTVSESLFLPR